MFSVRTNGSENVEEENRLNNNNNEVNAIEQIPVTRSAATSPPPPPAAESLDRLESDNVDTQSIDVEHPHGLFWICHVFASYGRQRDASLTGLILLLGHGLQYIWALNTMQRYHEQNWNITFWGKTAILAYYVGAALGNILGAFFVTSIRKKSIYVSRFHRNVSVLLITVYVVCCYVSPAHTEHWRRCELVGRNSVYDS